MLRLGALVDVPPVVPNWYVFPPVAARLINPPVPVQVNPVAIAQLRTVLAPSNSILPEPNAIERVFVLLELNRSVVNLKLAKSKVPEVNVVVPATVIALCNVVVPEWLIVNVPTVLPFEVIVPVPTIVAVRLVNVPPLDIVNDSKFKAVAAKINAVVPKLRLLNQLLVVNVAIEVPLPVNVKLGALVAVPPPPLPNVNVLVLLASAVKPPVPVQVKLVALDIERTVVAAVVCVNIILLVPKTIERTPEPVELNIPVVKSNPFRFSVPAVSVVVAVAPVVNAPAKVVVPFEQLIVNAAIVLPFDVIVPVSTVVIVKLVNVPPLESVIESTFNDVAGTANAVVPKFKLLNQLPVVNVWIAVPLPVKVKFGLLVAEPPVVPTVNVLVISAAAVNPPVPVYVKPVAVAIDNTVEAAVVVDNIILLVPNAIERVLALVELKVPIVKSYPPKFNVPTVKIHWDVAVYVCVLSSVNVTPVPFTPIPPNCLLNWLVQVCVLVNTGVKLVNVLPLDSVKVSIFNVVAGTVNAVVPKLRISNQLPVVNVWIAVPLPVSVKLGAFVEEPPVVPNEYVLVILASAVKPPVPVYVKPVAVAIDNTVVAAVVCANIILPEPNRILRVLVLSEMNEPTVIV